VSWNVDSPRRIHIPCHGPHRRVPPGNKPMAFRVWIGCKREENRYAHESDTGAVDCSSAEGSRGIAPITRSGSHRSECRRFYADYQDQH
jgi:hypothetical protein